MKSTKKQFRANLGSTDAKAFGLDYKACHAGAIVDLTEEQVKTITDKYPLLLLDPEEAKKDERIQSILGVSKADFDKGELTAKGVAKPAEIKGVEEESPVSASNAAEAISTIENMRSKDKLQHVIDNDPRATVKEAAKKRLAAL